MVECCKVVAFYGGIYFIYASDEFTYSLRDHFRLGLDQPLPVQYLLWVQRVLKGDFEYFVT